MSAELEIVTVVYGRVLDLELARRCIRCEGRGVERFTPDKTCPQCGGSGIRPRGWAYRTGGLPLNIGDLVEVPRTKRSAGREPQLATVIDLAGEFRADLASVLRVVEAVSA